MENLIFQLFDFSLMMSNLEEIKAKIGMWSCQKVVMLTQGMSLMDSISLGIRNLMLLKAWIITIGSKNNHWLYLEINMVWNSTNNLTISHVKRNSRNEYSALGPSSKNSSRYYQILSNRKKCLQIFEPKATPVKEKLNSTINTKGVILPEVPFSEESRSPEQSLRLPNFG